LIFYSDSVTDLRSKAWIAPKSLKIWVRSTQAKKTTIGIVERHRAARAL